jgi:hypothetical protein
MLRQAISDEAALALATQLNANFPARLLSPTSIKAGIIPKRIFTPDRIFQQDTDYILVHALATGEIPVWVRRATKSIRKHKNIKVLLLAAKTEESSGPAIASAVADDAQELGFGLAINTDDGTFLVLPPNYKSPKLAKHKNEGGHIPSWLYQRARAATHISSRLREVLEQFCSRYERATRRGEIAYTKECRLLTELTESIAEADPRLFYPLDRLQALRAYERGQANAPARDHFFHTLNNFFLGLVVLDGLLAGRHDSDFPDGLIGKMRNRSRLNLWETLWFLTALFHDPGYIPENFWSLVDFAYGLPHDPAADSPVPPEVRQRIENAWNTQFVRARRQMSSLYRSVLQHNPQKGKNLVAGAATRFDSAAREAYFDGRWTGHSLISGLTLIHQCMVDDTSPHHHFHRPTALHGCDIAALSMLFHDQHCRNTLVAAKIPPISFERLPYAATLMFVDSLQDERRERNRSRFPKVDVLESIRVSQQNRIVTARVCLPRLDFEKWPKRIAEYENVMRWVNSSSFTKLIVEYQP